MSNQPQNAFPASTRDVSLLKQTASDAACDLNSTAITHAAKAGEQLKDLAGHFQVEGGEQVNRAKEKLTDLVNCARDYAAARPLVCIGTVLAIGFLFGLSRRRAVRN